MAPVKSSFLDKVLGRIGRLDAQGLQTVVKRLARERSFLETLFNSIEDGILVVDETGRVLYFNQAVPRLFGLQSESVEGQPLAKILPEFDWEKLLSIDQEGGQRVVRHEFEISYPRQRFIRLSAAPLDGEDSGASGLALILHDATEARQRTFEAIESERVQALTLLAASVAHEIGNPLNALHIHLQLMERELRKLQSGAPAAPAGGGHVPGPAVEAVRGGEIVGEFDRSVEKIHRYLSVAKGEIGRLDTIITQFLQAIRPTPPQLKIASVNDVVLETLELLKPEIENRGQILEEKLARPIPDVLMDPGQIKQVLVNLTKNACQAMGKGGVLTLQTGATPDEVWFRISDTGRGIAPDQLNRIFEPFFTTKKKGSGLGLMIVQRIVRAHKGRIELDSRQGRGTSFRIWLPLHSKSPRLLEAPAE